MSVRRDGSYVRSQRLLEICKEIAKSFSVHHWCRIEDLKLSVALNMGLTETKALEYIDLVVRAKGWQIKDGVIYPGGLNE